MKKLIQLVLLGIAGAVLAACHTTEGFGRDLQEVGEEMEESSREVH